VLQKSGDEYCRVCGEFVIHSGYFIIIYAVKGSSPRYRLNFEAFLVHNNTNEYLPSKALFIWRRVTLQLANKTYLMIRICIFELYIIFQMQSTYI
jgi:hypothetical protein